MAKVSRSSHHGQFLVHRRLRSTEGITPVERLERYLEEGTF